MRPAGSKIVAQWREAGEWWNYEPYREWTRVLTPNGVIRETARDGASLGRFGEDPVTAVEEDHSEEWSLRTRRIRDEKVAAACGRLSPAYYEQKARERANSTTWSTIVDEPKHISWIAKTTSYVPLHVYSGYAFGRSTMRAEEIAAFAALAECPAVAIADPHSLVGCVELVKACRSNGVKPLVGASIEVPEGGLLVLIAKTKLGYRNLSRLVTECHLSQPRGYPMAGWEALERFSEDLLCLTGGDSGPLDRLVIRGDFASADRFVERLVHIYGRKDMFIEIERSFLPWTISVGKALISLAKKHRLVPIAGGLVTHARRSHFSAQDVLVCIDTLCGIDEIVGRKMLRDPSQPRVAEAPVRALNAERYFHSSAEMAALFADTPELVANTHTVSERCEMDVLPPRTKIPRLFEDDEHALREIVAMRSVSVYDKVTPAIRKRLDMEVERIVRLGFSSHFLVASETCRWAREQDIQLSGRGSVIDSAVAYVLGFSRIDAIRHNLYFDRFLPDDGSKRPDIDIDFEARRRDDVRGYLIRRFGVDRVATVAAIGTYFTRGIVREVGKVFGVPPSTISYLSDRLHGGVSPDQLEAALEKRPELRDSNIPRERFRWVMRLAQRLMDVPRNIRCHSSGVVISDQPLCDTVPIMWSASDAADESGAEDPHLRIIQWDKYTAKSFFDKFDILCLRGQDVLSKVQEQIRVCESSYDVTAITSDDPETYRAMRSGELIGIPQSASPAMRQAHMRIRTQNLTDASLVQAGIRPGVGGAVKINELIRRRRGLSEYSFEHPELDRILGKTYGIVVFQEQIDQLLEAFCRYSAGQAEDVRDSIHKRRREDYGEMIREKIIERILWNGFSQSLAEHVFELIAGFKGYGFAEGHALAFAEISIRCIHLMQHRPAEYFAALLSSQPAGYYGPCTIANEARWRGVRMLGPCVLRSRKEFTVEEAYCSDTKMVIPSGAIRVGLGQVSGLSAKKIDRILECQDAAVPKVPVAAAQPLVSVPGRDATTRVALADHSESLSTSASIPVKAFRSLFDFVRQIEPSRDELEALVLCGALDDLHPNRKALLWAVPEAYRYLYATRGDGVNAMLPEIVPEPEIGNGIEDFSVEDRAVHERTILSLDIDRHLMAFEREVIANKALTAQEVRALPAGKKLVVVGNPIRLRFPPTPSGKRVVFFDLEDETGLLNVTCFDRVYQRDGKAIITSPYVTLIGYTQDRDGHTAFLARRVFPYRPQLLRGRGVLLPVATADFLVG